MLFVLVFALAPVPLFYLIYFRHFHVFYRRNFLRPRYFKHAESFLFGILLALLVYLCTPVLDRIIPWHTPLADGFLKAALFEKSGALIFIYLIQRKYGAFSILEGTVAGVFTGTGFALVENLLYVLNFGDHIIIARTFFSTPLHITTCGLTGYFLGQYNYHAMRLHRVSSMVKGLLIPGLLHGVYDFLLLSGGTMLYVTGPMIFAMVILFELILATSKLVPPRGELRARGMDFEEWRIIFRQPRFERWIRRSMGLPGTAGIPVFRGGYGTLKSAIILLLLSASVAGALFSIPLGQLTGLSLNRNEFFLLFSIFPASAGLTLLAVGAVNPDFLRKSLLRIPIIVDAVLPGGPVEETIVTFDITPTHCFLRTGEPLGKGSSPHMVFECRDLRSPKIRAAVSWENHHEPGIPKGTVVRYIAPGRLFLLFYLRYMLFRVSRGVVFSLKLPGFQTVRGLFMRLSTIMQKEIIYKPGAVLFRENDEVSSFYFVRKGNVELSRTMANGEKVILDSIEAGQIFNEMTILGKRRRTVSAVCTQESSIAVGDPESLEALIRNSPDFALALIQKLAQRIDRGQESLMENIEYLKGLYDQSHRSYHAALVLLLLGTGHTPLDGTITVTLSGGEKSTVLEFDAVTILNYLSRTLLHEDRAASPPPPGMPGYREMEEKLSSISVRFITGSGRS